MALLKIMNTGILVIGLTAATLPVIAQIQKSISANLCNDGSEPFTTKTHKDFPNISITTALQCKWDSSEKRLYINLLKIKENHKYTAIYVYVFPETNISHGHTILKIDGKKGDRVDTKYMLYNGINGVLIPMYSMDLESALQEAKTMISKAP